MTVEGIEEETRKLRAAAAVAHGEKGVGEAAGLVAAGARLIGPDRTGRLSSSYEPLIGPDEAAVSSSLIYAPAIEHGWRAHNITPQRRVTRAYEANESEVEDRMGQAIEREWQAQGGGR